MALLPSNPPVDRAVIESVAVQLVQGDDGAAGREEQGGAVPPAAPSPPTPHPLPVKISLKPPVQHPVTAKLPPAKPPADDFSARLLAMAQQQRGSSTTGVGSPFGGHGAAGHGGGGVLDLVRVQIERHWNPAVPSSTAADLVITLHLRVDQNGVVVLAEIVDDPRFAADTNYHSLAASARRAALLASPLDLPANGDSEITVRLNPREALQ